MKILSAVIMLVFMSGMAMGQITGSGHDFSGIGWNSGGEICQPCHTPHNAMTSVSDAPLWNHAITATATFTLYSGYDLDATMAQPASSSKLCLSCHDGTVALENFGGTTTGTNMLTGDANLGTTLADDHPISFTYNTALATADGELYDPASVSAVSDLLTTAGTMECSSCHDVHDDTHGSFLVMSNASSALCLTCHNK